MLQQRIPVSCSYSLIYSLLFVKHMFENRPRPLVSLETAELKPHSLSLVITVLVKQRNTRNPLTITSNSTRGK